MNAARGRRLACSDSAAGIVTSVAAGFLPPPVGCLDQQRDPRGSSVTGPEIDVRLEPAGAGVRNGGERATNVRPPQAEGGPDRRRVRGHQQCGTDGPRVVEDPAADVQVLGAQHGLGRGNVDAGVYRALRRPRHAWHPSPIMAAEDTSDTARSAQAESSASCGACPKGSDAAISASNGASASRADAVSSSPSGHWMPTAGSS